MSEAPRSFSLDAKSRIEIDRKILPKMDAARIAAESERPQKDPAHPGPFRFAIAAPVAYSIEKDGTWQTLSDGRLWRLAIQSPDAKSMNLAITRFDMPAGAKLWIYDAQQRDVDGPYTARDRSHLGSLYTPIIVGNEVIIEVFVPTGTAQPVVEIGKVNQGFRDLTKGGLFGGSEGTCENDVVCPVGDPWRRQIRAVGMYTISGTDACTGNLMNDTAQDFKPYILSANHCGVDGTNDASIVFYWNFQSATCGTHGPGSLADNQSGALYHANYAPSDFVLFELSQVPDASYNVYYAGWDASGAAAPSAVGIHQPDTDVKAISFANTPPRSADWTGTGDGGTLDTAGNHWRVDWNSGVTEPGSSGSCIFETNTGRCIGQLHGGPSACGLAQSSLHDYYGKLSVSWNGGGTAASRLKDWLDPLNSGTLSMDGDPHITTANGAHYDFQGAGEFVALRDKVAGLEIQTRQAPVATTYAPPADAHDGLATCVSINTAVAVKVGEHRVTYEPNLSGVADPAGMQLRVDGALIALPSSPRTLGPGARLLKTSAPGGLEIDFPDASSLYVTPDWWQAQQQWYLNVDVVRHPVSDGADPASSRAGGIMGAIDAGTWLPRLASGASVGAMPDTLAERYNTLYKTFATSWRVSQQDSLFDYASGTSSASFTLVDWPAQDGKCSVPHVKPVAQQTSRETAQRLCQAVQAANARNECVFDVMATGNRGFAQTRILSQKVRREILARPLEPVAQRVVEAQSH